MTVDRESAAAIEPAKGSFPEHESTLTATGANLDGYRSVGSVLQHNVGIRHEFDHEGRFEASHREYDHASSCAGERDVEKSPFLGVGIAVVTSMARARTGSSPIWLKSRTCR